MADGIMLVVLITFQRARKLHQHQYNFLLTYHAKVMADMHESCRWMIHCAREFQTVSNWKEAFPIAKAEVFPDHDNSPMLCQGERLPISLVFWKNNS